MAQNDCPNCGSRLRKTGRSTPGNTPEKECVGCWWNNTQHVPRLDAENQGKSLSKTEAKRLA